MNNVATLIERLGGNAALGRAIGEAASTISEMKRRKSIPVKYWPAIRSVAKRRRVRLTYDDLVAMHTSHPPGGSTAAGPASGPGSADFSEVAA